MSDDLKNPYAAPPEAPGQHPIPQAYYPTTPPTVMQVLVVSILQIVEGVLELLVAALVLVYGGLFGAFSLGIIPDTPPDADEMPTEFFTALSIGFFVFGGLILVAAILRICAGVLGLRFKGRKLGIAASVIGMTAAMTFYCAPFAIGMLIYSLIIYLDRNVKKAFELAADGMPANQIRDPATWR